MSPLTTTTLHSSRSLYLRRTVPNDTPLLYTQAYSQREFMRLFRLNDSPANEAEVYKHLWQRQQSPPNQDRYLELLIVHRRYGPIGICALAEYVPLHRRAEYLIGLFRTQHRYVGYGLEVSLMILDLAFNTYRLHKLYAITYAYNKPAQKGLLSLGFQLEGIQKEHIYDPVEQRFVDLHNYGMIETEFRHNQRLLPLAKHLLNRDITQAMPIEQPPQQASFIQSGVLTWCPS